MTTPHDHSLEFVPDFVALIRDPIDAGLDVQSYLFGFELAFRVSEKLKEDFSDAPEKAAALTAMIIQAIALVKLEQSLHQ